MGAEPAAAYSMASGMRQSAIWDAAAPTCGPQGAEQCPLAWNPSDSSPAAGHGAIATSSVARWSTVDTQGLPPPAPAGEAKPIIARARTKTKAHTAPPTVADGARWAMSARNNRGWPVLISRPKDNYRSVGLPGGRPFRKRAVAPLGGPLTVFNIEVADHGRRKKL
jgi:hypothetical protein